MIDSFDALKESVKGNKELEKALQRLERDGMSETLKDAVKNLSHTVHDEQKSHAQEDALLQETLGVINREVLSHQGREDLSEAERMNLLGKLKLQEEVSDDDND